MHDPVRIFVGTDRSQSLAVAVLEHSIRRHTSREVEVRSTLGLEIPEPADVRQSQRTGFSFARWAVPELADHRGRAIYVDADMLVFRDIEELWSVPLDGAKIAVLEPARDTGPTVHYSRNETSVMVLDCEACDWRLEDLVAGLDEGRYDYAGMMRDLAFLAEDEIARTIPADWNRLETLSDTVGLLHYTIMPTQPWVCARNALGHLWIEEVRRMVADGALARDAIEREVELGYFRPSLIVEVDEGPVDVGDEAAVARLERLDASRGYRPHRDVEAFNRQRAAAIKRYERDLAWRQGPAAFTRLVAVDCLNAGKRVVSRALGRS